jgi:methylisocitrate lyase
MSSRSRLRDLIAAPDLLILPGVYDAFSARIAERAGFPAISAGGNASIGSMLAGADIGQSNMRDIADNFARICAAVDIPVSVDADSGFGTIHNVRQTIRAFENAGVSGILLNDQVFPNRCHYLPGKQVVSRVEFISRIKAALDVRRDEKLAIIARTDAVSTDGWEEAIERCNLALEAGADFAKPQGIDTVDQLKEVVRLVPCPAISTWSQAAGPNGLDAADYKAAGVSAVTLPTIAIFAAMRGLQDVFGEIRKTGSLTSAAGLLPQLGEYYDLVNLMGDEALEQTYLDDAKIIVETAAQRIKIGA